jgi:hypothetical protein
MKKLMLTTALAGLLVGGNAIAQTTVTGELRLALHASAAKGDTTASKRSIGNEQQINIQTKGKLNVGGLDYAAGFSIENDGSQTTTLYNENVYMDFTNAGTGTTVSISRDHIQRADTDRSNGVFFGYSPLDTTDGSTAATSLFTSTGSGVGQAYGIGIIQNVGSFGKVSYFYAPSAGDTATTSEGNAETDAEAGYEYGFTGDLGVKGLDVYAFKNQINKAPADAKKAEFENYGIKYTTGQITGGYTKKTFTAASTSTAANKTNENHYGLAYAVDKDLTIGVFRATVSKDGTAEKEKVDFLQVGYNLGPVALLAGVSQNRNISGSSAATADADTLFVRLVGAF